jgi:hypothetical protein
MMAADEARVIQPGDPDHPAEQVKRAGPSPAFASYAARITIHGVDPARAPTIKAFASAVSEALMALVVEPSGSFIVNVDVTRTDR